MLINLLIYNILSNAVTILDNKTFYYSRNISIGIIYSILLCSINIINIDIAIFNGLLHIDNLIQIFTIFILLSSLIILNLTNFYIYNNNNKINKIFKIFNIPEYSIIILFINIGAILLISSLDIVTLFLSLELQSYGLYILCTLHRNSESSTSAGLKYFLLGSLASCLILLGLGIIYANLGNTNLENIQIISTISYNSYYNILCNINFNVETSIVILCIGFLFKIAAAPVIWFRKSLKWERLPNSGEPLKLFIPSYIWKIISGWINNSCKVISKKIIEKWMGDRGSKSDNSVKEQRVYGNRHKNYLALCLRYTLMSFERNRHIRILSNQKNNQIRLYSEAVSQRTKELNPVDMGWFISGLIYAEGCFMLVISRNSKNKIGWAIKFVFKIGLHKKDKALLEQVQSYFCVGNIYPTGDCLVYQVESIKDLLIIIKFFDKYQLITKKFIDYVLFKQAVMLALNKEHLTYGGLKKIVGIKASINRGLSQKLQEAFPSVMPAERPLSHKISILNPHWLAGFTSGEGCFFIVIHKSVNSKLGEAVQLRFILVQHIRDIQLMEKIKEYFNCGQLQKNNETIQYTVSNFLDLNEKILPFFNKYLIKGVKYNDFLDWSKAAELIKNKVHLTAEGLSQIKRIKEGMNKKRN